MKTLPGHAAGPCQHRLGIGQLGPVPVLFQDSPATLHRIVFAVVRRVVQEVDGLASVISKFDHTLEKLRAAATALRAVINLDLESCHGSTRLERLLLPRVEAVDEEIAGLVRASEEQMEVPTVFMDHPKRRVFFLASHVVIRRPVVAPRLAASRVVANIHCRLAVHAQAQNGFALASLVTSPDVGEDGVGFRDFFWGLALTTGRSR